MSLTRKIVWIGVAQLTVLGGVLIGAYYFQARREIVQQYVEKSRAIVLTAEATREEMGRKWAQGIFTTAMLAEWARHGERDKVVSAVPVVTAWRAAMAKSTEGGYTLRVPKFQPRNPQNEPDATEARVLRLFEQQGASEHYEIDRSRNAIRYFRPIRLTEECLNCHGDPATSATLWGNDQGLDPTGGPMENWKVGEVHGAFEVVQSLDAAEAQVARSMWVGAGVVVGLVALSAAAFLLLIVRQVVRPVAEVVNGLTTGAAQVADVAAQVSQSAQEIASGASEQAATLEETSASMEEMASMTRQNADHTRRAAELMTEVDGRVAASIAELDAMVATMRAIHDSSERVARIIKTIDDIAFQTNILALNAAVEAARAGDLGSGFAVVANEVRSLAQRSAEAARHTSVLIEEASANAAHGASRVDELEKAVHGITDSVARVRQLVDGIRSGSAQQAEGTGHVGKALQQMEQVTQGNAAAAEESAAASEELSAQAETTRGLVDDLRRLIGITAQSRTRPGADETRPAPRSTVAAASIASHRRVA